MKRLLPLLLAGSLHAADIALVDGDQIVVCGDSLTFLNGWPNWSNYVHAYLALRNPTVDFKMESIARSGLSIAGMLDASASPSMQIYAKWIASREPDYVFSMFADNGSHLKSVYKGYAQTLVDTHIIGVSGATPYLIGMIPQSDVDGFYPKGSDYDDANQEISDAGSGFPVFKLHQNLLSTWTTYQAMTADNTTDTLTSTAHGFTDGTRVIFQGGTAPGGLTAETYYYVRDAAANTFKLSTTSGGSAIDITSNGSGTINVSANWAKLRGKTPLDEVHPSTAASIIAAWKIIVGLGWGTNVSAATLTAAGGVTSSTDCTISANTTNAYDGIDFSRLDSRLPWAIDEEYDETGRAEALALYPAMAGWQSYTLTVSGLTAGTYDVYIDGGVVASVSHTTLAAGWNMADLTTGPVWTKGQAVLGAIRDLQGISRTTLLEITSPARLGVEKYKSNADSRYETYGERTTVLKASLATVMGEMDTLNAAVITAAQPSTLAFSLRRQGAGGGAAAASRISNRRRAASALP